MLKVLQHVERDFYTTFVRPFTQLLMLQYLGNAEALVCIIPNEFCQLCFYSNMKLPSEQCTMQVTYIPIPLITCVIISIPKFTVKCVIVKPIFC